jgi:glycosyltransferase involved in cell wall biosynthesis
MKVGILVPKIFAYSQGWIWNEIDLISEYIGYIGSDNPGVKHFGNNIPIVNIKRISLFRRVIRRIYGFCGLKRRNYTAENINQFNKKFSTDAIIIHFLTFAYELEDFILAYDKKIYIHCHGHDVTWEMRSYLNPTIRKYDENYFEFIKKISGKVTFIANSIETKNRLLQLSIPNETIKIKYFGVNVPTTTSIPNNESENIKILYVGRFVDCKGPDLVIRAFEEACEKGLRGELIMIGDGPLLTTCLLLRENSKFKNRISLLGVKTNQEVAKYMSECDIFTAHNIEGPLTRQVEAFGVSFLEAMSYSLPVVTGNSGGINEIVVHEKSGYLIEPGNICEHADKLIMLANNDNIRLSMGQFGRNLVIDRFSLQQQKDALEKILVEN